MDYLEFLRMIGDYDKLEKVEKKAVKACVNFLKKLKLDKELRFYQLVSIVQENEDEFTICFDVTDAECCIFSYPLGQYFCFQVESSYFEL